MTKYEYMNVSTTFFFKSKLQIRSNTSVIQSVSGCKGASLGESGLNLKHLLTFEALFVPSIDLHISL